MGLDAQQLEQIAEANGASDKTPAWAMLLQEVLTSFESSSEARGTKAAEPQPFEALWSPFSSWACEQVLAEVDLHVIGVSHNAFANLQDSLVLRLAQTSQHALLEHFSSFRIQRRQAHEEHKPTGATSAKSNAPSSKQYDTFLVHMQQGGMSSFFVAYPILARLISQLLTQWMEATKELLDRFREDRKALESTFGKGEALGYVAAIETDCSDPHSEGRRVSILTFSSRVRVVYKPRDVGIEAAFGRFLQWVNEKQVHPHLQVVAVLVRPSYGWVEFVPGASCRTAAEARLFYERIGALLCLLYALCGRDVHVENLVANGAQPVIVDPEGLLHPELKQDSSPTAALVATQLLPIWQSDRHGRLHDVGGVDVPSARRATVEREVWIDINTDSMRLASRAAAVPVFVNVPKLQGKTLAAADYIPEILDGFSRTFSFLRNSRQEILGPDGPLDPLARQPTRFFPRPTRWYLEFIRASLQPRNLLGEQGVEEVLEAPENLEVKGIDRHQLVDAERWALRRLDIPRFEIVSQGRDLRLDTGSVIRGAFATTGRQRVDRRLQTLEEHNRQDMQSLIRTMLSLSKLSQLL